MGLVGVNTDHADQLVTDFIDGDKSNRTLEIDLSQPGEEPMRELLDRIEKAKRRSSLLTCISRSRISGSSSGLIGLTNIRHHQQELDAAAIACRSVEPWPSGRRSLALWMHPIRRYQIFSCESDELRIARMIDGFYAGDDFGQFGSVDANILDQLRLGIRRPRNQTAPASATESATA